MVLHAVIKNNPVFKQTLAHWDRFAANIFETLLMATNNIKEPWGSTGKLLFMVIHPILGILPFMGILGISIQVT